MAGAFENKKVGVRILFGVIIGVIALAVASAQTPDSGHVRGRFGPSSAPLFDGGARFLGAEPGRPGRVVKNAPYSADVITETTQALPDGNRIRQSNTVHVSRDSEGRTRSDRGQRGLHVLAGHAVEDDVDAIDREGEVRDMIEALGTLRPRYQRALTLRYLAGLSADEAATAMGCSKPVLAVTLHRALGALRRAVEPDSSDPDA